MTGTALHRPCVEITFPHSLRGYYSLLDVSACKTTPTRTRSVRLKHDPYERDRCSAAGRITVVSTGDLLKFLRSEGVNVYFSLSYSYDK